MAETTDERARRMQRDYGIQPAAPAEPPPPAKPDTPGGEKGKSTLLDILRGGALKRREKEAGT